MNKEIELFSFKKLVDEPCNQVGIVGAFELKETPGKGALVSTVHLKAKGFEVLREKQAKVTVEKMNQLKVKYEGWSLIITGDLNAFPEEPCVGLILNSGYASGTFHN